MTYLPGRAVMIDYTNYEGRRSTRVVTPDGRFAFADNPPWHKTPQWLFWAWDHAKGAERSFALDGIHSSRPATPAEVREADAMNVALA